MLSKLVSRISLLFLAHFRSPGANKSTNLHTHKTIISDIVDLAFITVVYIFYYFIQYSKCICFKVLKLITLFSLQNILRV